MSKLLVVEFRDRAETNKGVLALAELSTSRGSPLYASAVVAKDPAGKTSVQEITDEGLSAAWPAWQPWPQVPLQPRSPLREVRSSEVRPTASRTATFC